MQRRTIRIGVDWMLDVELTGHGWEITVLNRTGKPLDLFIEANLEDRDRRVAELGGRFAVESLR